jgi:signal transduction histidine kinase
MAVLGWVAAALFLAAALVTHFRSHRARAACEDAQRGHRRLEEEQNRVLEGLILGEEAASRILTPGELGGTVEKIAKEAVDILGASGVCVLVRPPDGEDEPTGVCSGRIPDGLDEVGRPTASDGGVGFGSVLCVPIRMKDRMLGEFRVAEKPGQKLTIREVHIVRLLAQLVAIATQYRLQRKAIERAEDDKRRFILATTHDLRSPVSTIEQLTKVLVDGYAGDLNPKQKELVEKIGGRADHLLDLLSDLLSLAMEDQDLGSMRQVVPVSLSRIYDVQIDATQTACEARGLTLHTRRPDSPLMRMAAEGDMENILANLLSNAVKYTPHGGDVEVSLDDSPGGISFRVTDTGIGIPKEALPRLFTEYFRAPNAKQMERHGTGLGLALVQKLVRKYNGKIRVESTEGKGTTIEVLLPPD